MGARGKYKEWLTHEGLLRLEAWARDGLSDEQIAHNIGIRKSTLYDWKKRFSEFSDALKKGKEVADIEIENALNKSAKGYFYEEVKTFIEEPEQRPDDEDPESRPGKTVKTVKTLKHVPGNVTAQIYWLKTRKPEVWQEKINLEHSGEVKIDEPSLKEELSELKDIYSELSKRDQSTGDA